MTKAEFLKQLDKRLQILKQNEREDILGEYAQHIELKMENGLNEEEAIRDFGELEELAEEILDAYNVDPLYGREEKHTALAKLGELGKRTELFGVRVLNGLKAAGGMGKRFLCRMGSACRTGFLKFIHWRPFGEKELHKNGETSKKKWAFLASSEQEHSEVENAQERRNTKMWGFICQAGRTIGRLFVKTFYLCFRLGVIMLLAPVAFCDGLALIGLGALVVLVMLGYPVVGVTIMTFGALACGGSFVWLVWNLVFGKRKERKVWASEES